MRSRQGLYSSDPLPIRDETTGVHIHEDLELGNLTVAIFPVRAAPTTAQLAEKIILEQGEFHVSNYQQWR